MSNLGHIGINKDINNKTQTKLQSNEKRLQYGNAFSPKRAGRMVSAVNVIPITKLCYKLGN